VPVVRPGGAVLIALVGAPGAVCLGPSRRLQPYHRSRFCHVNRPPATRYARYAIRKFNSATISAQLYPFDRLYQLLTSEEEDPLCTQPWDAVNALIEGMACPSSGFPSPPGGATDRRDTWLIKSSRLSNTSRRWSASGRGQRSQVSANMTTLTFQLAPHTPRRRQPRPAQPHGIRNQSWYRSAGSGCRRNGWQKARGRRNG